MGVLFLTNNEIAETTIVGGNVERDKYRECIITIQETVIESMLGTLLYDKIVSDLQNSTLADEYLTIFNEFVKPITKWLSVAEYIEVSNYYLGNKGLFKPSSENSEIADKNDRIFLSSKYKSRAQERIERFGKWIKRNNVEEYQRYQDEVNATDINRSFSWYFK